MPSGPGRTLRLAALLLASIPAAPPLAHAQGAPPACRGAARPSCRMRRASCRSAAPNGMVAAQGGEGDAHRRRHPRARRQRRRCGRGGRLRPGRDAAEGGQSRRRRLHARAPRRARRDGRHRLSRDGAGRGELPTCSSTSAANPIRANRAIWASRSACPAPCAASPWRTSATARGASPSPSSSRQPNGWFARGIRSRTISPICCRRRPARALPVDPQRVLQRRKPFGAGERLIQPDLAETLAAIGREGPGALYTGPIMKKSPPPSATPAAS